MRNRRLHLLHAVHSGRCWLAFAAWVAIVLLVDVAPRNFGALTVLTSVAVLGVVRTIRPRTEKRRVTATRAAMTGTRVLA